VAEWQTRQLEVLVPFTGNGGSSPPSDTNLNPHGPVGFAAPVRSLPGVFWASLRSEVSNPTTFMTDKSSAVTVTSISGSCRNRSPPLPGLGGVSMVWILGRQLELAKREETRWPQILTRFPPSPIVRLPM